MPRRVLILRSGTLEQELEGSITAVSPEYDFRPQLVEVAIAVAWTTVVMLPLFFLLKSFGILRCSFEEEVTGLSFEPVDAALFTNEAGDSVEG